MNVSIFLSKYYPPGFGWATMDIGYFKEVLEKVSKNKLNNITWSGKQQQQSRISKSIYVEAKEVRSTSLNCLDISYLIL